MVGGGSGGVCPSLGLAWASLVGTRVMLFRDEVLDSGEEQKCSKVRIIHWQFM